MSHVPRSAGGCFIVLEGIDGAGTTTHSKRLATTLQASGKDVRLTCEPTTGPVGSLIRQMLQRRVVKPDGSKAERDFSWSTMALLFAADRLDHLDSLVLPALRDNAIVISDRYYLSSLAYQSVTAPDGQGVLPWIREVNSRAVSPDLTIVVDVPTDVAAQRRRQRGGSEELFDADELQARLARAYLSAEELVPGDRLIHISGDAESDVVAERILEATRRAELDIWR